jgi:RNase P subunit RPR2
MTIDCANCHTPLGDAAKRAPVHVDDAAGGARELFCPRCFVYVRAPLEPVRFAENVLTPLSCTSCGWESVALGAARCAQCRSTLVVALGSPVRVVLSQPGAA